MRLVYANARYEHHSAEGGQAHMRQFIQNAGALGHEIFLWHGVDQHPLTKPVPQGRLERIRFFRTVDVIYYRIEWKPPIGAKVILPPYRRMIGDPLIVWEFNTVPEYGRVQQAPEPLIESFVAEMKRLAPGVNLAVCVSRAIQKYVHEKLGIARTIVVPNGSDPELFRPDVAPVKRVQKSPDRINVVWIGSANLGWHNFDLLRDAAWSIWNPGEGDRIVFHIIGPGMQRMREAPPNLNYYGSEQYLLLPAWLSAMDVGLNVYHPGPADYSSPLKIFDYMASGLTVVSTEQPQAREVFQQLGQTDLLVPSDNPEALANVLRSLSTDRDRLHRQGAAGRKLVIDQYNWRRAARDTFAEIDRLLAKPI
ncbi:MAG TPA: glycosyltransferase [Tepidisphaeraceae bacterium]|nr:glycosyltransferase [Tepidisphaeraceae bacterium]